MPNSLPDEVIERLQAKVRDEVIPRVAAREGIDAERAKAATARALKVDTATINRLVNKGEGGSLDLIRKVSDFLNDPPDMILWGKDDSPVRKLQELPDFPAALDGATQRLREHPGLSVSDLEWAGTARLVPEPPRVTAGLLIQLALSRLQSSPPPATTKPVTRSSRKR